METVAVTEAEVSEIQAEATEGEAPSGAEARADA